MSRAPLVFRMPGRLVNPLNVSRLGLWKHRTWARRNRERASEAARIARLTTPAWREVDPTTPKAITFMAMVWNKLDDDSLPACLKPHRDGLVDARLIHDDRPGAGHTFRYDQVACRQIGQIGVTITVEERP